jgi:hypothetical protein
MVFGWVNFIFWQFMLVQYGTYIAFSWDIMEPITCCMTMGDAYLAYIFWFWNKKSWGVKGVWSTIYERKKLRLMRKQKVEE